MSFMRTAGAFACALTAFGLSACGDISDAAGKQGRLRFALQASSELETRQLEQATLVAGHRQLLRVDLTTKGEEDIGEPDEIAYRLSPRETAELKTLAGSSHDPPDIELTVHEPGRYALEALYKGRIIDVIDLRFDTPDALELSVKVRAPYDAEFHAVRASSGPVEVAEGTHAIFVPIAKKAGRQLAGRLATLVRVSPRALVVPGAGTSFTHKDDAWITEGSIDFYFIDPGRVTITLSDPISNTESAHVFDVTDAP